MGCLFSKQKKSEDKNKQELNLNLNKQTNHGHNNQPPPKQAIYNDKDKQQQQPQNQFDTLETNRLVLVTQNDDNEKSGLINNNVQNKKTSNYYLPSKFKFTNNQVNDSISSKSPKNDNLKSQQQKIIQISKTKDQFDNHEGSNNSLFEQGTVSKKVKNESSEIKIASKSINSLSNKNHNIDMQNLNQIDNNEEKKEMRESQKSFASSNQEYKSTRNQKDILPQKIDQRESKNIESMKENSNFLKEINISKQNSNHHEKDQKLQLQKVKYIDIENNNNNGEIGKCDTSNHSGYQIHEYDQKQNEEFGKEINLINQKKNQQIERQEEEDQQPDNDSLHTQNQRIESNLSKKENSFDEERKSLQYEKVIIDQEEEYKNDQLNKQSISNTNIHQFEDDTKKIQDDLQQDYDQAKVIEKKKFVVNGDEEGNKLSDIESLGENKDKQEEMKQEEHSKINDFQDDISKRNSIDQFEEVSNSTKQMKNQLKHQDREDDERQVKQIQIQDLKNQFEIDQQIQSKKQNKESDLEDDENKSKQSEVIIKEDEIDKFIKDLPINIINDDIKKSKDNQINDQIRSKKTSQISNKEEEEIQLDSKQEELVESNQIFVDPDFPPKIESISKDAVAYLEKCQEENKPEYVFKRVCEVITESPINLFFNDTTSIYDVKQGALGDCYFIVCMIVLAKYPEVIKSLFKTQSYNKNGKYILQLIKNGIPTDVVVDDHLPCYPDSRGFAFSRSPNNTAIWPSIIEKALAKIHNGYINIEGGENKEGPNTQGVLIHLIGCPSDFHHIELGKQTSFKDMDDAWNVLFSSYNNGFLQTTGVSDDKFKGEKTLDNGLVANHAYSILEVKQIDNLKLIKLKNPWAKTEWNKDWSDESTKWTEKLKQEVKLEVQDDGIFWMSFEDFYRNFSHVSTMYFNPNYQYSYFEIKNEEQFSFFTYNLVVDKDIEGYLMLHQISERFNVLENGISFKTCSISFCVFEMNEDNTKPVLLLANKCQNSEMIYSEIKFTKGKKYQVFIVVDFLTSQSKDLVLALYANQKIEFLECNLTRQSKLQVICDYLDLIELSNFKEVGENTKVYQHQIVLGSLVAFVTRNQSLNKYYSSEIKFKNENISLVKDSLKYSKDCYYQELEYQKYKIMIPSGKNLKLIFKQSSYHSLVSQVGYDQSYHVKAEIYPSDEEIQEMISSIPKVIMGDQKQDGELYKQTLHLDTGVVLKIANLTQKKFSQKIKFNTKNLLLINNDQYNVDNKRFYNIQIPPQSQSLLKFKKLNYYSETSFGQTVYEFELTD